jgi:hypothetical protein
VLQDGWADTLPAPLVTAGLWGAGSAQLLYPVAELVVKPLIIGGVLPETGRGIGNMSGTGWFNFTAAKLVFGVPGALFMLEGFQQQRRSNVVWYWAVVGTGLGVIFFSS